MNTYWNEFVANYHAVLPQHSLVTILEAYTKYFSNDTKSCEDILYPERKEDTTEENMD